MSIKQDAILIFHQSVDLYGSDKTLLALVQTMKLREVRFILLLPRKGPLTDLLDLLDIEYVTVPLTLISRSTFSPLGLYKFLTSIRASQKAIDSALNDVSVHTTYSNTIAVFSGWMWAYRNKKRHIWHVHEIIRKPRVVRWFFSMIVNRFSDRVICNSKATLDNLIIDKPSIAKKSVVILNGVKKPAELVGVSSSLREEFVGNSEILVGLIGRVHHWKGHKLLIEAAEYLWDQGFRNIAYVFVGDAPAGQLDFQQSLELYLDSSEISDFFVFSPFTENVWDVWEACDIAVVPSIEPEPFGLVAIEAMLSKKPVIAANHGGLVEIVVDGVTGLLFEPNSSLQLSECLKSLVTDKEFRTTLGRNGNERAVKNFSEDSYSEKMLTELTQALA